MSSSLEAAGMHERSNDEDIAVANDQIVTEDPLPIDREGELAELAHLADRTAALSQAEDEMLHKCLLKVQQNCMLALNTLIFSTLTTIKPIISTDWKSVSERYSPNKNLRNLNLNVNYALQTHLHAATSGELNERIERISYLFSPIDAKLVVALNQFTDVLMVLTSGQGEAEAESARSSSMRSSQRSSSQSQPISPTVSNKPKEDVYDFLQSQMSKLKLEMRTNNHTNGDMWLKVETFINLINILCIERENISEMPPSYSDLSPTHSIHRQLSNKSASTASIVSSVQDEKMRRDLERVTDSIDRLMRITPQLASQRVELTQKQIIEMDLAKLAGEVELTVKTSKATASTSKQTTNGVGKFFPKSINSRRSDNQIISGIEKANSRRLDSQRVDMGSRLEDAHSKMRDADLIDIIQRNRLGRLVQQESEFSEGNQPRSSTSTKSARSVPSKNSVDSQTHNLVSQQAYLAEHNVNVGNVLVQFKTQLHGHSKELELEVDQQAKDSVILKNLSNFNVRLKLPTRVVYPQRKKVKLVEKDLFEFNLQVSHQSRKSLTTPVVEPPSYPFSAIDFATTKPSSFRCAKCSRDLSNGVYIDKYRDLPSDNWSEHVDNWMCHPTQELNADYYRESLSNSASPNEALIGSNYWVFNKKNIIDKSVRVEYNDQQLQHSLRCVCGCSVGSVQSEAFFRFNKVAVCPVSPSKAKPYYTYNIGHYISAELVDQSRNYGTYRYFLQDENTGELRLLVWLFNPLVKVRTSQVRLNSTIEACKLFWKTNREEPLHDSRMSNIAKLSYPAWILDDLENILVHGIGSFLGDSPKRFFSDWHIGYIERVPK